MGKTKETGPSFVLDEGLYDNAVLDMAMLLLNYGFTPDKAIDVSKKFWKKYKKMLVTVV